MIAWGKSYSQYNKFFFNACVCDLIIYQSFVIEKK